MEALESSWPEGFYNTIKWQVVTFSGNRKAADVIFIDQEAIYARVIGLMVSQLDVDFGQVISSELAAYPPSMFRSDGSIIANHLSSAEVHLILDRYCDFSTKSSTRAARVGKAGRARVYKLTAKSPLPPRDAVLQCAANTVQLNLIICEQIINAQDFLDRVTQDHRLFLSGVEPVPIVVNKGRKRGEIDLYSTHEEADIRLVKHALWACKTEDAQVCVVSDDTDVFALLC